MIKPKKIVLLPLDERPCNAQFVPKLFDGDFLRIQVFEAVGYKKQPAKAEDITAFLLRECLDADGLVLSMDMLLYGGLIPSRIHHLDFSTMLKRMEVLSRLKKQNPQLVIYAFQCVMRCPQYSCADEEPDYYGVCGREIFLLGQARHRYQQGLSQGKEIESLYAQVPDAYLNDYLERRALNLKMNCETLKALKANLIDFLIIPQDDSAKYGYTAQDQAEIRQKIAAWGLQTRVMMYPGADEVALTLTTRFALSFRAMKPKVWVKYAATGAPFVVPLYEDRMLNETIKYQIIAAGCKMVGTMAEADIALFVTCPSCDMREAVVQPVLDQNYTVDRTLLEFSLGLQDALDERKIVTIGDNAYANGGDLALISLLDEMKLLHQVHGYAGWNTSSNTLGTAMAQGVCALLYGMTNKQKDFIALRYVEDVGYCSVVRRLITENELSEKGMEPFDVRETHGQIAGLAQDMLRQWVKDAMPSISDHIKIDDAWMPWKRMFEIGLSVHWED